MHDEVTVVIPTRDRIALLLRAVRSVLAQQGVQVRVVVVDDGSRVDVAAALHALQDQRVEVIRHPQPRGQAAARNTGLYAARSPWVGFLDDDDLWAPVKLRAELEAIALARGGARWAFSGVALIDKRCRVIGWIAPPDTRDVAGGVLKWNLVPASGSSVLVARDLAVAEGGFDEALNNLSDWDFCIRLSRRSDAAIVYRPLVGYYLHGGGASKNLDLSLKEYRELEAKWAAVRRERGVRLDREVWASYIGTLAFRVRRPWLGLRRHGALLIRRRRLRSLFVILAAFMPFGVNRVRSVLARRRAPSGWQQDAASWLAPYRPAARSAHH